MHRASNGCEEGLIWIVPANHLDTLTDFDIGFDKLAHRFRRAAGRGRETTDDVEYMQKRPLCLRGFETNRFMVNQEPGRLLDLSPFPTPARGRRQLRLMGLTGNGRLGCLQRPA
jgi:hypothetical protein